MTSAEKLSCNSQEMSILKTKNTYSRQKLFIQVKKNSQIRTEEPRRRNTQKGGTRIKRTIKQPSRTNSNMNCNDSHSIVQELESKGQLNDHQEQLAL
jgi:hypothetical protein